MIGVARKGNAEELKAHGAHLVVNDLAELSKDFDEVATMIHHERLKPPPQDYTAASEWNLIERIFTPNLSHRRKPSLP